MEAIPKYGTFLPPKATLHKRDGTPVEDYHVIEILVQYSSYERDLRKHYEEIMLFMVDEGLAINRRDIKMEDGYMWRELTDRGRRLKELGSYEDFIEEESSKKRREARNEKLISVGYLIAILVGIAAFVSMLHDISEMASEWPVISVSLVALAAFLSICILGLAALYKLIRR